MRILYLEPFHEGSHRQFGQTLMDGVDAEWCALTLPGRHWKWRMRGAASWFALEHADRLSQPWDLVFASSYVALAELVGLCPALAQVPRLLYFHENQLSYPQRDGVVAPRDHHFGFTQLVSALAADRCVFNSCYNRDSFLEAGDRLLTRMPDAVPVDWIARIRERSEVLAVPMLLPSSPVVSAEPSEGERRAGPIVLWAHRWEYDKRPDRFFAALEALAARDVPFRVAVCGQSFRKVPDCFEAARDWLGERIVHWGWLESREAYEALMGRSHIAVSTADHEFFGISMVEAVHFGAQPLVPDALAYPERFPKLYRYRGQEHLVDELERLCRAWSAKELVLRGDRRDISAPLGRPLLDRYQTLIDGMALTCTGREPTS